MNSRQCSSISSARIVDAVVVVLRPLEHDGAALEGARVLRVRQVAVGEFLRDHAGLHHGVVEQVALEDDEAGILAHRRLDRRDHVRVADLAAAVVVADGLAVGRHRVLADVALRHQLGDHGRYAAGAMELLAEILAGRLHVHQQRDLVADRLPFLDVERHADVTRDGVDVDRGVGRAADGGIHHDAFSIASRVMMSDGFRSSHTMSTMRRPVS